MARPSKDSGGTTREPGREQSPDPEATALGAQLLRLRSMVDAASDGLFILDAEGQFLEANDPGCEMLGYSRAELLQLSYFDVVSADSLVKEPIDVRWLRGGGTWVREREIRHKNGSLVRLRIRARMLADGSMLGWARPVAAGTGLEEELERQHAELDRLTGELRAARCSQDELLASVSHELRTPLVTGIGYVELLLENQYGELAEGARSRLDIALRNLRRLSAMIDDILAYHSFLRAMQLRQLTLRPVGVVDLLDDCVAEFLVRHRRDTNDVELDVEPDVGAVLADERLVRRALCQLLDNAARHAGSEARVIVSARRIAAERLEIAVTDNGQGVPPAISDRVFEPLVRATGSRSGTGLGLPLARRIVEAHGSLLKLSSAPGQGTVVSFSLQRSPENTRPDRTGEVLQLAGGRR